MLRPPVLYFQKLSTTHLSAKGYDDLRDFKMIPKVFAPELPAFCGGVDLGALCMRYRDLPEPANDGMYTKWKMRMGDLDVM